MAKDYSSIYSIKDFFLNVIAPTYFEVDNLAQLNAGLLGMLTDITGTVTEDQFNTVDVYLNETMPGKENLPDFIYAKAANYGVSDLLATAACMPFLLFIKESDVINNGTWANDVHTFTIDSGMTAYVDDLPYSIPYNITIRSTLYKGNYNHIAYYDKSFINDAAQTSSPYLRMLKTVADGDEWLAIRVDAYQYIRRKYTEVIITNNKLNIPYVEENYSDQLCNFEVFYQESEDSSPVQLIKRLESSLPISDPFVFYKLNDDGTIRLSFPADDRYFIPAYNSILTIYLYETQGDQGNFKMYDNANISIASSTESDDVSYNRSVVMFGMIRGDSVGGLSQKTKDQIKQLTLEKQVTIDSYTTDTDLNVHFTTFSKVYDCNAIFIKYRDDDAGRVYGCFTKLSDGTDTYPTNTLNIRLDVDQVDHHFEALKQYVINPGTRYGYVDDTDCDTVMKLSNDIPQQRHEYTSIFLTVITIRPNSVNYYMNSVNKTVELAYTSMNTNSLFNFLTNNCTLSRNAISGQSSYKVSVDVSRVDGVVTTSGNNSASIDYTRLKVLMIFDTNEGHYVPMELSADTIAEIEKWGQSYSSHISSFKFETSIDTDDMIDDNRISLTNLRMRSTGELSSRIVDMVNPDITIAIFYKYEEDNDLDHDYKDIEEVGDYTLCNTYTPYEDEFYFAYPMTLMRSTIVFEDSATSSHGYNLLIKRQPLFGHDFIMDESNFTDVVDTLVNQHKFLTSAIPSITASFTINIEFYNTYGRSKLFYLSDTSNVLNHVDANVSFRIKFYDGINENDYLDLVKQYIKSYIEQSDQTNVGTNRIHISELIQKLHNNFEQIEYINFNSLNDYPTDIQDIEMSGTLADIATPDTIPEYITIKVSDVEITTI